MSSPNVPEMCDDVSPLRGLEVKGDAPRLRAHALRSGRQSGNNPLLVVGGVTMLRLYTGETIAPKGRFRAGGLKPTQSFILCRSNAGARRRAEW